MTITLDKKYNASADTTTLGYVGETNARTITFEGYQCEGADSYKMRFKYADGVAYEVDISADGTYTIDGSILRIVGAVYVQIFACRHNGDTYDYVKKSNIMTMCINRSLDGNVAPVPTYEQSVDALEKMIAAEKSTAKLFDTAQKAAENAAQSETAAQVAAVTATDKAKEISESAEQIQKNTDDINKLYNNGIVCESDGSAIALNDSSELPFNGMRIFGRSEQLTTTGAQLLNPDLYDTANTRAGVTANANSDGSITLTGTTKSTDQYAITYFLGEYIDLLEDGKEYSINTGFRIVDNGAVRHATKIIIKPTITSVRPYVQVTVADYTDGMTIYPMFNSGNTVAEWEPCTGSIPSPNPNYPQEIVSVGDSNQIIVTVSDNTDNVQALTVSTPNGLPGIPVDSGGNYTDGSGQQWICDEIDLGRGVYVKRIHEQIFSGAENWEINVTGYGTKYFMLQGACKPNVPVTSIDMVGLCEKTKIVPHRILDADDGYGISYIYFWRCNFAECDANNGATVSDLKSFLSNNPMTIFYAGISVETPLTDAEISAYKSLHTNKPTTTITNSDSAHMAVSYTADTKTYIDNKFNELAAAIIATE